MQALERLARRRGVLLHYRDGFQRQRTASVESLIAILGELGAPIKSLDDAPEALRQTDLARWRKLAPPVSISWGGEEIRITLRLPAHQENTVADWTLQLESGESRQGHAELSNTHTSRRVLVGSESFVAKTLRLPGNLPFGYHRLRLEVGGLTAETVVMAAPRRCWQTQAIDRSWGAFLPLYALHTEHSWGAGSFTDLGRLFDWVQQLGGRFVGTLPLLASYLDEPFEYSPYVPASRLFWNEFYVNPRATPEWERSPGARKVLAEAEESGEIERLRSAPLIDYRAQAALQRRMMAELSATAFSDPQRRAELEAFAAARPPLEDYAKFRAAVDKQGKAWTAWPVEMQQGGLGPDDYDSAARDLHVYAQWAADAQLTTLAESAGEPGLYLDLPLGVHGGSYDVWRNPACYAKGSNGGAPPDSFFTQGQNWGFAPLHPSRIREDGYRHLSHIVAEHLRYAGILRVDHFMWLHRLYWVPQGAAASEGTYVQYPAEELYAVLCIESHRGKGMVVGEDLGTVPAYVRSRMSQRGIDRMYVAQFSFYGDRQKPLHDPPAEVLASVNTHDTPTWATFWSGAEIDDQVSMGLLNEEEASQARSSRAQMRQMLSEVYGTEQSAEAVLPIVLEQMARSDARAVLVNLEDLWSEPEPQNMPGTGQERPNWRRRAQFSLERMQQDETVQQLLALVNRSRSR